MATVNKDFKIKSGLVVEGPNGTINGSDIITEDAITGGTQTNITVTYDAQNKVVNFVAENGVADSTTDDLAEGTANLYYTDARARSAISAETTGPISYNSSTGVLDVGVGGGLTVTNGQVVAKVATLVASGQYPVSVDANGNLVINLPYQQMGNVIDINQLTGEISLRLGSNSGLDVDTSNFGLQLEDAAANVGTFGSGTEIPTITVDDKGRVTAVTTSSVATDLSIAGDTGTDTVALGSDTLTFTGGTGITSTVTDNTVTLDIDSTVATLEGSQNLKNKTIENATIIGGLNASSNKITNLGTPTSDADAATKLYVDTAVSNLVDGAPALLDTLNELAAAINDDASFATTITNQIGTKQDTLTAGNAIFIDGTTDTISVTYDAGLELDGNGKLVVDTDTIASVNYVDTNFVNIADLPGQLDDYIPLTDKGAADGVATLDQNGQVPLNQLGNVPVDYITSVGDNLSVTSGELNIATTPTFTAVDINSVAKQVAATVTSTGSGTDTVYQFDGSAYRSAKFLVKIASGTHTQVSEVLLTLDTSNNLAITEYAIIGTNGSLGDVTATYGVIDVITNGVSLIVTDATNGAEITVMGTLLA